MHIFLEILVDGFIVSSIYALGAIGFSLIFGTAGILNLSHGAYLVVGAIVAWFAISSFHLSLIWGIICGVTASTIISYILFFFIINPLDKSNKIPKDEKEVFILTATLLWSMVLQGLLDYFFGSSPIVIPPFAIGVIHTFGLNLSYNEVILTGISLIIMILLWFFINKTKTGKMLLAASMSHTGIAIMGIELKNVYIILWGIYGIVTGLSGILLASFLGASASSAPDLTGLAFSIVVLGGLGSLIGSVLAAYIIGYISIITSYLISPSYTSIPAFVILIIILLVRPKGLFGRF